MELLPRIHRGRHELRLVVKPPNAWVRYWRGQWGTPTFIALLVGVFGGLEVFIWKVLP
jgi:hypothetical protein